MLRFISYATLGVLLLVGLFIGGCAQQRVAGTQERVSTVAATITSSGLQLNQSQVPPGTVNLRVTNNDTKAHVVTVTGPNYINKSTANVMPGKTVTLSLPSMKSGSYKVFVKGMQNQAAMTRMLTVSSGKATTTTTGAAAQVVTATLTASGLQLSKSKITAGNLILHVKNNTNKAQSVILEGPNNYMEDSGSIQPGQTKTMTETGLKQGAYSLYVKGMENQSGMKKALTVSPAGKVAGTPEKAIMMTVLVSGKTIKIEPESVTSTNVMLVLKNNGKQDLSIDNSGRMTSVKPKATTTLLTLQKTGTNQWMITSPITGTTTGTRTTGVKPMMITVMQAGNKIKVSPESVTGNDVTIVFKNAGSQNAMFSHNNRTTTVKPNETMTLVALHMTKANAWTVTR